MLNTLNKIFKIKNMLKNVKKLEKRVNFEYC